MELGNHFIVLLPRLRRFSRALTGSQDAGDSLVASALEQVMLQRLPDDSHRPDVQLFRVIAMLWQGVVGQELRRAQAPNEGDGIVDQRLAELGFAPRTAFLLTAMEQFTHQEAAGIMQVSPVEFGTLLERAKADIAKQVATSVLIIEDELFIAVHLEQLVIELGHVVTSIARTRTQAIAALDIQLPGLVLADIQLADGSSGIDTVNDILARHSVPVIFITAYPEKLLTGLRPEPTFLVAKPFRKEDLQATISQALFFRSIATGADVRIGATRQLFTT